VAAKGTYLHTPPFIILRLANFYGKISDNSLTFNKRDGAKIIISGK
jgi:hypothetical protein